MFRVGVVLTALLFAWELAGCASGPTTGRGIDRPFDSLEAAAAAEDKLLRDIARTHEVRFVDAAVGELKDGEAGWGPSTTLATDGPSMLRDGDYGDA